jgi:N-acetylmuramoyl-L-alanine amidase
VFQSRRCWLVLACLLGFTALAVAPARRTDYTSIRGRLYIDAVKWAQRNSLTVRWNSRSGDLHLTNRWTRLAFKTDTARIEHNGVLVWLSSPVAKIGDRPLLPVRDLDTVLTPLMRPPKLVGTDKITKIALSAGHGGKDPGNMEGGKVEKEFTLKLAKELERQFERAGFEVIQMRDRDRYIAPEDRPAIAKKRGADLYLSLHYNAQPTARGSAQGLETYWLTLANGESTNGGQSRGYMPGNRRDRENLTLAYQVHRSILGALDFADRGVRRANFAELRLAEMPAILIEGGFMDSRADALTIYSDVRRAQFAAAVVDGVLAYKRLVERGQPE